MHTQFGHRVLDMDASPDNVAAFVDAFNNYDNIATTTDRDRAILNASAGNGMRIRFFSISTNLRACQRLSIWASFRDC